MKEQSTIPKNKGYIYVRNHDDWKKELACKLGVTDSLINRESGYKTGEYLLGEFTTVIEVPKKTLQKLDNILKDHFKHLHRYKGAGTEFYDLSIENKLFSYLKTLNVPCKKLTKDEINCLKRKERLHNVINALKKTRLPQMIKNRIKRKMTHINNHWFERQYQRNIIEYGVDKLTNPEIARLYLELATGGGKSYCIYSILKQIMPNVIVIMSPRKKINRQNCSKKYLSLLNNEYNVFNMSESKQTFEDFKKVCEKQNKKIMIVGCPQKGHEKVYDFITEFNLNDVFIWFDEAHNTVENWVKENHKRKTQFLLNDVERIKYRIFTSASPDKETVNNNQNVFGELYSPIKVKDLIALKWLCPIECKILQNNLNNTDFLSWILDGFNEDNKIFGFSFHSRDNNAFNLFYEHYQKYNNDETSVKPYLLIHQSGLNDENKQLLSRVQLNYAFTNQKGQESFEKSPKSIAYVVKQYDMGYDFKDLDYIVISDPKLSYKDIIQCIGRGTRPDCLDENGRNLNKSLLLMLPTYIDNEEQNKYKRVIEVLRYLKLDLDYNVEYLLINSKSKGDAKCLVGKDYGGNEKNNSILLDLLYSHNILKRVNTKALIKFCKKYNIKTHEDYHNFKENNPSLNLKQNLYQYPGFNWKIVVDPDNEHYYSSKKECKKAEQDILSNMNKKLENNEITEEEYELFEQDYEFDGVLHLHNYDPKIPPYQDLDKYYPE